MVIGVLRVPVNECKNVKDLPVLEISVPGICTVVPTAKVEREILYQPSNPRLTPLPLKLPLILNTVPMPF